MTNFAPATAINFESSFFFGFFYFGRACGGMLG